MYDFAPFPEFSTSEISSSLRGLLLNYVAAMWELTGASKEKGQPEQALEEATFATKIFPYEPFGYMMQGDAYVDVGRVRDAEIAYKEAVRIGSSVFQAHEALAEFYATQGETEKAIGVVAGWIAEHPDDGVALDLLESIREKGEVE